MPRNGGVSLGSIGIILSQSPAFIHPFNYIVYCTEVRDERIIMASIYILIIMHIHVTPISKVGVDSIYKSLS